MNEDRNGEKALVYTMCNMKREEKSPAIEAEMKKTSYSYLRGRHRDRGRTGINQAMAAEDRARATAASRISNASRHHRQIYSKISITLRLRRFCAAAARTCGAHQHKICIAYLKRAPDTNTRTFGACGAAQHTGVCRGDRYHAPRRQLRSVTPRTYRAAGRAWWSWRQIVERRQSPFSSGLCALAQKYQ